MVIYATDVELDLSGTPAELRAVSQALSRLAVGENCVFSTDLRADPAPYDRLLSEFQAVASAGPVKLSVVGDRLLAAGSPEMLACLASFFDFPDDAKRGDHCHHEWFPGNDAITPDSRPLVVSVAVVAGA